VIIFLLLNLSIVTCQLSTDLLIGTVAAKDMLTDRYNITCLDLAAGLPHNNVNQIFADSQGFVWISTYGGGAVRYDGYSFTMPVLNRLTQMSSNSCKGFAEDRHQRLRASTALQS
jgi:ligand-binding sensor domain-containing protein